MESEEFTTALTCNHCSNVSAMAIKACYSQVKTYESVDDVTPPWEEGDTYYLLLCPSCNKVTLMKRYYHSFFEGDDGDHEALRPVMLYPTKLKIPEGLPDDINKSYMAALKVRSIDANAYAVLLGRVLDKLCDNRSAQGESLYDKLKYLAEEGEIPLKLSEMAHSLRQLRNVGAHANLGELTPAEIPFLDALCNAVLEYVYSAPLLIQKAQTRFQKITS